MTFRNLMGCFAMGILTMTLLTSCGESVPSIPAAEAGTEEAAIQEYLKGESLFNKAQKTESGIYYIMEKEGTGEHPDPTSTITAHYHGMLLDGKVFDSSVDRGEPFKFQINRVIPGWQEAMTMLKTGGKGRFVIPSSLAYGERGAGGMIPPNSPLAFDIELLDPAEAARLEEEVNKKKAEAALQQATADDVLIKNHLAKIGFEGKTQRTDSGIYYTVEKAGKGDNPTLDSKVKVHYHGTLLDGTVFDSSVEKGNPIEFPLRGVVKGWQEAVPLLKPGGKGKFFIPSGLAYGPNPRPGGKIPPNAVLVFDIDLLEVQSASK